MECGPPYCVQLPPNLYQSDGKQCPMMLTIQEEEEAYEESCIPMSVLIVLTYALLVSSVVLTIILIFAYFDGIVLNDKDTEYFNLHILFSVAFLFFTGFAMLQYRFCGFCAYCMVKILHALFHLSATVFLVLGFMASYAQYDKNFLHFYSLHAWIGLLSMLLYSFQIFYGFIVFIFTTPCNTPKRTSNIVPYHAGFGLMIFTFFIMTAITGLTEIATELGPDYKEIGLKTIIVNGIGACLIMVVPLMSYVLLRRKYTMERDVIISSNEL